MTNAESPMAEPIRVVYVDRGDNWRVEGADGTFLYDIRLLPSGTLHRFGYYVLRDHHLVHEGMFVFDIGSHERVRDVIREMITAVVQEMSPNAEVTVDGPPQRGVAPERAATAEQGAR